MMAVSFSCCLFFMSLRDENQTKGFFRQDSGEREREKGHEIDNR